VLPALALLVLLSVLNWWGIRESAVLSAVFTVIESLGLLLVIVLALISPARQPNYLEVAPGANPLVAVMVGAAIFYFAYTGFEFQPTLSEETRDAERVIPEAIVLAVLVTTLLYLAVSLCVVRLIGLGGSWSQQGSAGRCSLDRVGRVLRPAYGDSALRDHQHRARLPGLLF
jgi:amino acid transporter